MGRQNMFFQNQITHFLLYAIVILTGLVGFSSTHAAPILAPTDFVFTDDGGAVESAGNPANTANGLTANGLFSDPTVGVRYSMPGSPNTPVQTLPITFTYMFNQLFNINGNFTLYNGWDCCGQAIDAFTLSFLDIIGDPIGAIFSGNGISVESAQIFSLGATYMGVKSVELTVTSVHENELEFREVAFEGTRASIPEPTVLALVGLGLVGVGWRRRKAG